MEFKQLLLLIFLLSVNSNISPVKADFGETIASIILFVLVTTFICAGIGWWSKRNETKY